MMAFVCVGVCMCRYVCVCLRHLACKQDSSRCEWWIHSIHRYIILRVVTLVAVRDRQRSETKRPINSVSQKSKDECFPYLVHSFIIWIERTLQLQVELRGTLCEFTEVKTPNLVNPVSICEGSKHEYFPHQTGGCVIVRR